jgi:hypothetical protein
MTIRSSSTVFLTALCLSLASCGSVANRAVSGAGAGGSTGADAASLGGATGSDGGGGGGSPAGGASGGGGTGAGGSSNPGIFVHGSLGPFGPAVPAAGGSIRVSRQTLGAGVVCMGNVCATGGLSP